MKRIILFYTLLVGVFPTFGQRIIQKPPPIVNDTLYVGITNNIEVREFPNLQSAKSDDAHVRLNKDTLVIIPRHPGDVIVTLQSKEIFVQKKYFAIYLPDPFKSQK